MTALLKFSLGLEIILWWHSGLSVHYRSNCLDLSPGIGHCVNNHVLGQHTNSKSVSLHLGVCIRKWVLGI